MPDTSTKVTGVTVVGIFRDQPTARQVANDLISEGFSPDDVHISSEDAAGSGGQEHKSGFIRWLEDLLTGDDSEAHSRRYADALRKGNCALAVETSGADPDRVIDIMNRYDAIDITNIQTEPMLREKVLRESGNPRARGG